MCLLGGTIDPQWTLDKEGLSHLVSLAGMCLISIHYGHECFHILVCVVRVVAGSRPFVSRFVDFLSAGRTN